MMVTVHVRMLMVAVNATMVIEMRRIMLLFTKALFTVVLFTMVLGMLVLMAMNMRMGNGISLVMMISGWVWWRRGR
jgi:hypothetical protein